MHACNAVTLDQLLSLRDGEPVAAELITHTEQCTLCARELNRLRGMQSALRSLPNLQPPPYDASAIRKSLQRSSTRPQRWAGMAAAAGLGAVTLMLILTSSNGVREQSNVGAVENLANHAELQGDLSGDGSMANLVIRSQELESRLRSLPPRPRIQRGGTAVTINALQNQIQWVDYQLSLADEVGMSARRSTELWQDRVQLMDTLVKVRYAEAERIVDLR